ncbi:condensation domain-containing protein [Streptomyces sp. INA 01156]
MPGRGAHPAGAGRPAAATEPPHYHHHELSEELTAAVASLARRHDLTANTVVQASWGVLLGRLTGRDDVVFGSTVSGRPPEMAGMENMVGLFINTLPVRVRLDAGQPVADLLRRLQDEQSELMDHQHYGLSDIQSLLGGGELFDTITAFESYPVDTDGFSQPAEGLRVTGVHTTDDNHYPISLAILPASGCGCVWATARICSPPSRRSSSAGGSSTSWRVSPVLPSSSWAASTYSPVRNGSSCCRRGGVPGPRHPPRRSRRCSRRRWPVPRTPRRSCPTTVRCPTRS